jgi:acyl-CoA reductase-like NAD-dependent aldehyde dehydrogenase
MGTVQRTISPVDGSVYVERPHARDGEIEAALERAKAAQRDWKHTSIAERAAICTRFVDHFIARTDELIPELAWQMGRPISGGGGEIRGFEERARHMIAIAPTALADVQPDPREGFTRFIRRAPLGVVLVVAAWNYPYLISVNSVVPALMAGNAVVLKHSAQTPLCAERYAESLAAAGLPDGLFQVLHMTHEGTAKAIGDARVDFVAFTGSVGGGHAVQRAATERFIATGLELGGKDPAYVRADANLDYAVENLVDGANFNSGQSCCGIERIYVHGDLYDRFISGFADLTRQYKLGNPLDPATNLGPMVRTAAADFVRGQTAEAVKAGAKALVDPAGFAASKDGTPYLAPQVLVDVDHSMAIMRDESFGPVVGIMKVSSDEEAIRLMNDSDFGLTASVWTQDEAAALNIGDALETGTCFMNRADYLDPALSWVGVKDSGRGCTLSQMGYEHLTRPKSFHLRTAI